MADVPSIFGPVEDPGSQGVGGLLFDPQNYERGTNTVTVPAIFGGRSFEVPRYGRPGTNDQQEAAAAAAAAAAETAKKEEQGQGAPFRGFFLVDDEGNFSGYNFETLIETFGADGVIPFGIGNNSPISELDGYDDYVASLGAEPETEPEPEPEPEPEQDGVPANPEEEVNQQFQPVEPMPPLPAEELYPSVIEPVQRDPVFPSYDTVTSVENPFAPKPITYDEGRGYQAGDVVDRNGVMYQVVQDVLPNTAGLGNEKFFQQVPYAPSNPINPVAAPPVSPFPAYDAPIAQGQGYTDPFAAPVQNNSQDMALFRRGGYVTRTPFQRGIGSFVRS